MNDLHPFSLHHRLQQPTTFPELLLLDLPSHLWRHAHRWVSVDCRHVVFDMSILSSCLCEWLFHCTEMFFLSVSLECKLKVKKQVKERCHNRPWQWWKCMSSIRVSVWMQGKLLVIWVSLYNIQYSWAVTKETLDALDILPSCWCLDERV